jgi:DnaJ-domain-containing protein 1
LLRLFVFLLVLLVVLALLPALVREAKLRERQGPVPGRPRMTRSEALLVLGLNEGATKEEILTQYRRLVSKVHPDTPGGSTYLTAQINQARDVLLR